MDFPHFDAADFRRALYTLWFTQQCELDVNAAASGLGVSTTTLRRWLAGSQRVPVAVWRLTWLLSSGALPEAHGWAGWLFLKRWEPSENQYVHRLVAPNGVEYSAGYILSWHFQSQRLQALVQEVEKCRRRSDSGPVINLHDAHRKLSRARLVLDELAEQFKVSTPNPHLDLHTPFLLDHLDPPTSFGVRG